MIKVKNEDGDWDLVSFGPSYQDLFDLIYPVGSYYMGDSAPSLGTWEQIVDSTGRALWISNGSKASGTLIAQALPNITGQFGRNGASGIQSERSGSGAFSHYVGNQCPYAPAQDVSGTSYMPYFDASYSSSIYKNGANVQPNAYVVKLWHRTA